jgi:capsular polysaccharide biosynthesis protein
MIAALQMTGDAMNLVDYGRILARRGWIIVLAAIIGAASAFFLSKQQTPIVTASQVMLIQPSRSDFGLAQATTQLIEPLRAYLDSTLRAQQVIDNLQLDMLAADLLGNVNIATDRNSLTVQIDVDMADCAIASRIAEEWGRLLVQYRNEQNQTVRQEDRVNAAPRDVARCPTATTPNVLINTLAGGLFGAIIGIVIVFVLEYLESSIVRRREDIERSLELPVLASIPQMD